jgi:tetratricopeptide (TPR) repeat protein
MDLSIDNQQQNIDKLLEEGIELKDRGNIPDAIQVCQKAIQLNSSYYKSYYHLGDVLTGDRQLERAEAAYNTAIQLNPNFSWSYHGLSLIFSLQNKLDVAVESSRQAIELNPTVKGFYRRLAIILNRQGDLYQAVQVYKKAIEIDPEFAAAHKELADILRQQQDLKGALTAYQAALELGYENQEIYADLGSIYLATEQWDNAADFSRRAIKLKSDSPWTYYNLGYSLQKQGKHSEAISSFAKALQLDPGFAPAYQKLMFSQLQPQELNEVVAAFKYNIQQQPDASWLYTRLGDLLSKQGQIPEAIEAYQNATYKINLWLKPEYTKQYWHQGKAQGPNFMIIGAMKAGTTSLYEYINQHPQVLPCAQKEVHFFVHHFNKGIDWYLAHFPYIPPTGGFLTGEASPGYLCNTIQQQVKATFPQVKLIAILRNPVKRAISHYYHNVKHGIEMRSFEAAMTAEMKAIESLSDINLVQETKNWSGEQGYLFTGLYVYFLQKWMSAFDKKQFLIVKSEDLYAQSGATMKDIFDFLELPSFQNNQYENHLPGSYKKLNSSDHKYQLIANFFEIHNQRLTEYLQQPFNWIL